MKFVIITDIHLGPEAHFNGVLRKINKGAKSLLDNFVKKINDDIKPEFVVVLGDMIEDETESSDRDNLNYIVRLFKKLACPVHYVAGNHDLKSVSEKELADIFSLKDLYYSFDSSDLHFIVLFSKVLERKNIRITDEQKEWLKEDLASTDKKCIVFVHHSLADQDLTGNPWFDGKPEYCLVANRVEIRDILSSSKKVLAVFNSHLHWNRQDVCENIPYYTIQSLVENENDKGLPSEAYAIVDVVQDGVTVEIKGNYPKNFVHKPRV